MKAGFFNDRWKENFLEDKKNVSYNDTRTHST